MKSPSPDITQDPRWASIVARDKAADGTFWYSVATTGVFRRPSCRSRLANPKTCSPAHSRGLLADCPYQCRQEFMFAIDLLIAEVEHAHVELASYDRYPVTYMHLGLTPVGPQASSPNAS